MGMMRTTKVYAGGDVDGGGGVHNTREHKLLASAPSLHAHKPHCIIREVGGRRSGGGEEKTEMKTP